MTEPRFTVTFIGMKGWMFWTEPVYAIFDMDLRELLQCAPGKILKDEWDRISPLCANMNNRRSGEA